MDYLADEIDEYKEHDTVVTSQINKGYRTIMRLCYAFPSTWSTEEENRRLMADRE